MRHIGVRPETLPLEKDERTTTRRREVFYEVLPDGGYRIWNHKLLNSGCGRTLIDLVIDGDLIFCPTCKEWANKNQFQEIESE